MCGIVGVFSKERVIKSDMMQMIYGIKHRGPDATGLYLSEDETVSLGHTRLSIIDLSSDANQPFYSSSQRYVIVFNGEVYNFQYLRNKLSAEYGIKFKTTSDTEVIIEAFSVWRENMAAMLEGMFALAIYDQQEKILHLLRDRIGKKPLYYFQSDQLFGFSSEIKSLLRHPKIQREKKINRKVVSKFLHLGYIPEPDTIYANIYKFPSGHTAKLDTQFNLSLQPYWSIQEALSRPIIEDPKVAKKQLDILINNAVQKRLISDVPLGTFLSGGTDSSLVTAYASKNISAPLKTFSIGFKENKFDESQFARQVAKHLNTDHTEYVLHEKEAVGLLETYLSHFDEPFSDTSAIPTMLVSKLARKEVKVVLTGDGGDELFQGYGSYLWADRLDNPLWKLIKGPMRFLFQVSGKSQWQRVAQLLQPVTKKNLRSHIFSQEQYLFSQKEIKSNLLLSESQGFSYDESVLKSSNRTAGERQALFDLQYYLKDDLLIKVDRASMYYALECRCPLLDHHVIEYATSMSASLKRKNGKSKWLLKELLYDYLPPALVDRPKWGFSVPLAKWMKNDLRYLMENYLNTQVLEEVGLFNPQYVSELKREFLLGKDYLFNRLWVIIVLHKWWKENQQ